MFVNALYHKEEKIEDPSWEEIESAIRDLNEDDVHLAGIDAASMTIGGAENQFFTQITLDGDFFQDLLGPHRSEQLVPIVVGRQRIDMERRKVSNMDGVLKAAKTFAETGQADVALDWELS